MNTFEEIIRETVKDKMKIRSGSQRIDTELFEWLIEEEYKKIANKLVGLIKND